MAATLFSVIIIALKKMGSMMIVMMIVMIVMIVVIGVTMVGETLTWGRGRMTNRSKKKPFFAFKYRRATVLALASCSRLPSSPTTWNVRFAILSCSHMFQRCKASVIHRRAVTVMANHPSTKRHIQVLFMERT